MPTVAAAIDSVAARRDPATRALPVVLPLPPVGPPAQALPVVARLPVRPVPDEPRPGDIGPGPVGPDEVSPVQRLLGTRNADLRSPHPRPAGELVGAHLARGAHRVRNARPHGAPHIAGQRGPERQRRTR
ncbi:hypothetical protein ACL02T_13090 [Pseudonocardia sp. RS010]|uniref:hypothetical protein n=1 Tax=Pseudonocardia sp. RS010 TaxID=3385979 RepID=UPI0039A30EE8